MLAFINVLPIFALPFGGKLPGFVVTVHDLLIEKFGMEQGSFYFDKACIFIPVLIMLVLLQFISQYVQAQMMGDKKNEAKSTRRLKKGKKD
jgi:hypothetical protein